MARKSAPSSATGGAGFYFEDRVAAKFLLDMLAGEIPFGAEFGQVIRVDWQTRDSEKSEWLIDDLLLTLHSGNIERYVAISMKRNRQVTASGFPSDFVNDIWEMVLNEEASQYKPDRDLLVLVVGQLAQGVQEAWESLLRHAKETTEDRLVERMSEDGSASTMQRNIFNSLRCPKNLSNKIEGSIEIATAAIVKKIRLLHLDFDKVSSRDFSTANRKARDITRSGTVDDAQLLWNNLMTFAASQRPVGGFSDLRKLLSLPNLPLMREHPDLRNDWKKIADVCNEAMKRVNTNIGSLLLPRTSVFDKAITFAQPNKTAILLGDSGSGKSAMAKRLTDAIGDHTIWFDPILLNVRSLSDLQSDRLSLQWDLERIVSDLAAPHGLLVVDGIDRLADDSLNVALQIIQMASHSSKWSVVITCRNDAWDRITEKMPSAGLSKDKCEILPIPLLDRDDLLEVGKEFPRISVLLNRPEVRPLLANLKVLEWTIMAIQNGDEAESACSIPSLIDAIWGHWIGNDSNKFSRGQALKYLAELEGKGSGSSTGLSDLPQYHQILKELVDNELLTEKDQQVRFRHDLIGDWSRLMIIIERESDAVNFLRGIVSFPLWRSAIQLYGQRLLQNDENGTEKWKTLVLTNRRDERDILISDLMLESIFRATNAAALIELVWHTLIDEDGSLLRRFLDRFLHAGTVPAVNPTAQMNSAEGLFLKEMYRFPFIPYWLDVLQSLYGHINEVVALAPQQVSEIVTIWLKWMPPTFNGQPFPYRNIAADIAIETTTSIHVNYLQKEWNGHDKKVRSAVYKALLLAAQDCPDKVAELSLEIAGRRELSSAVREKVEEYKAEKRRLDKEANKSRFPEQEIESQAQKQVYHGFNSDGMMIGPFPDGPLRGIDDTFRKVCLESDAILPLFKAHPNAAKEVLLAACIRSPYYKNSFSNYSMHVDLDIEEGIRNRKPMWFQCPFYKMLQVNPVEALDIIIRLVGFATTRWAESEQKYRRTYKDEGRSKNGAMQHALIVTLPSSVRKWHGGGRVYGWYRNRLGDSPLIVSALMALEKYLYDQIDTEADITPIVDKILMEADSVAFVGVLIAVGKYQLIAKKSDALMIGSLKPFLSIWQLYFWEIDVFYDFEISRVWELGLFIHDQRLRRLFQDWNSMSHRMVDLRSVASNLLLSNREIREWFVEIRAKWSEDITETDTDKFLEILIAQFDPANYSIKQVDGCSYLYFELPEHLRKYNEQTQTLLQQEVEVNSFPVRCRLLLKQNDPLSDIEAEALWQQCMKLVEKIDLTGRLNYRDACIVCGGIAVLVCRKLEWLKTKPERFKWCVNQLAGIVAVPPEFAAYSMTSSAADTTWDTFFAETAIHLLVNDSSNNIYRFLACHCLCAFHYEATGFGMAAAWRFREELGDDVFRLLNVVTLWACFRYLSSKANQYYLPSGRYPKLIDKVISALRACLRYLVNIVERHQRPNYRYLNSIDEAISAFVTKKMPTKLITFREASEFGLRRFEEILEHYADSRMKDSDGVKSRRKLHWDNPCLDLKVIQQALTPLQVLVEHGSELRALQLQLFKDALEINLQMLDALDDSERERRALPDEFDRWLYQGIVRILLQMSEEENPKDIWSRILEIRPSAHHWLESFFMEWICEGVACESLERWAKLWHDMIEFALNAPNLRRLQPEWSPLRDVWIELLGFGQFDEFSKRADVSPVVESLIPYYERWAQEWLSDAKSARAFANFITKPAGQSMLIVGTKWLSDNSDKWNQSDWNFYHMEDILVSVVCYLWSHAQSTLKNDTDTRSSFLSLLNKLVSRGNRDALLVNDVLRPPLLMDMW